MLQYYIAFDNNYRTNAASNILTCEVEKSEKFLSDVFIWKPFSLSVRKDVGLFDGGAEGRGGGIEDFAFGNGDLGLPGAGDLGRPGGTEDLDWPVTAGDGDLGLPGPGDLGRGGFTTPPAGCNAGVLNEPMPNGSSIYSHQHNTFHYISASEMTYIVSGGALNSTHLLQYHYSSPLLLENEGLAAETASKLKAQGLPVNVYMQEL